MVAPVKQLKCFYFIYECRGDVTPNNTEIELFFASSLSVCNNIICIYIYK